jgi:hypothetical protein
MMQLPMRVFCFRKWKAIAGACSKVATAELAYHASRVDVLHSGKKDD